MNKNRPEPKYKRGDLVSVSNVVHDNPKWQAKIAGARWNKEYKEWEYTTPPFIGWQLEHSISSTKELS